MDEDTLTLEEAAKQYYSQLRGEFQIAQSELETLKEQAKTRMEGLVALAVENAANLMLHADSDAVKWNVTKYVIDNGLFGKGETPEDELNKIIAGLTKKPSPVPSE